MIHMTINSIFNMAPRISRSIKRSFLLIKKKMERCPYSPVSLTLPFYLPTSLSSEKVLQELKTLNGFSFLPNYGNMGDIVIAMAEYQFFEKHGLKYEVFRNRTSQDNLVYGGGGLFIRDWKRCYQQILKLFQKKHLKRIIILPSSFHDCPDLLEAIDERFTVFCREEKSRDYLLSSGAKGKVILAHDMALFLMEIFQNTKLPIRYGFKQVWQQITDSVSRLTHQEGHVVAYFLRTDSESNTDWKKIGLQSTLDLSLCTCSDSRDKDEVSFYTKLFFAGIDMADIVVTDRLHVGICSMLAGKEVFLLDNSYGKVSGVYERSMKQSPRVHFVDDVQKLPGILGRTIAEGKVQRTANLNNLEKIGEVLTRS